MRRGAVILFCSLEAVLYCAFLTMDVLRLPGPDTALKYGGILLCLCFALACALRGGDRRTAPALALTAVADAFLLVADTAYAVGIGCFLGVQALYALRMQKKSGMQPRLRLICAAAAIGVLYALRQAAPLNLLAGIYFSQLLSNCVIARRMPGRNGRLFAVGLALFVGCDLCVGVFNSPALFPQRLWEFSSIGMWMFYLPSQVCIALSAMPEKGERT